MCPRTLRYEQAFKLVLCDISSAYPTMIDEHVGSSLGKTIYDNLARNKNISRVEAKKLFNTALNSERFRHLNSKPRDNYFVMLLDCGYTEIQAIKIITEITDSKKFKFFDWASKRERDLIERFKTENRLQNGSRIHDALLFLYDSSFDYSTMKLNFDIFNFSFEILNEPISNNTFFNSTRFIKRKNVSFLPKDIGLANTWSENAPKDIRGTFYDKVNVVFNKGGFDVKNGKETSLEESHDVLIDVTFFNSKYRYLSANFKTEYYDSELGLLHQVNSFDSLVDEIHNSLRIIKTINERSLNRVELQRVLFRYKELSNLCFDVITLTDSIINLEVESLNDIELNERIKTRDYVLNADVKSDNDYVFNIALNKARAKVNDKHYLKLMLEWFTDNPNTFLRCDDIGMNRKNKRLKSMLDCFNFLFVGSKHFKSAQKMLHLSTTYDYSLLKYATYEAKSVRDTRNKTRNLIQLNKLDLKIKNIKSQIDTLHNNQSVILQYFNSNDIDKSMVRTSINYDSEILDYILDLKESTIEVKEIEAPKVLEFETDYTNSVFYHKVPTYSEVADTKMLMGYNSEFFKFHKENWEIVLEQIKQGNRVIEPYNKESLLQKVG